MLAWTCGRLSVCNPAITPKLGRLTERPISGRKADPAEQHFVSVQRSTLKSDVRIIREHVDQDFRPLQSAPMPRLAWRDRFPRRSLEFVGSKVTRVKRRRRVRHEDEPCIVNLE